MKKKFKGRTSKHSRSPKQERYFRTWSGISPILETEYPFEQAIVLGEYSEFLQRNLGSGIHIYPSTACICTVDTLDALLLSILGEQFREFYPGEMPWLSRTTTEMCATFWLDESDTKELYSSLLRLAKDGFIDLDTSTPGIYRYRLNVDTVRHTKNKHFVPLSELERIEEEYTQTFPEPDEQKRAFAFICDRSVSLGRLMLNLWHLSLNETTRAAQRDPNQGLAWINVENMSALRDEPLFQNNERKQQAFERLIQKGFLEVRQRKQDTREYRPNAAHIWAALNTLPEALPELVSETASEE
jgi:hypothetical protein